MEGMGQRASVKQIIHMSSPSCLRGGDRVTLLSEHPCKQGRHSVSPAMPPQGQPQTIIKENISTLFSRRTEIRNESMGFQALLPSVNVQALFAYETHSLSPQTPSMTGVAPLPTPQYRHLLDSSRPEAEANPERPIADPARPPPTSPPLPPPAACSALKLQQPISIDLSCGHTQVPFMLGTIHIVRTGQWGEGGQRN